MSKIQSKTVGFLPEFLTSFAAAFTVAVLMSVTGKSDIVFHSVTLLLAIVAGSSVAYLLRTAGNRKGFAA